MTQLLKTIIIALIAAGLTACNNSSPTEEQGATPADNVFNISVENEQIRTYTCPYNISCDPTVWPTYFSSTQTVNLLFGQTSPLEEFQFHVANVSGPGLYADKATISAQYTDGSALPAINWSLHKDVAASTASVNFYEFSTSGGRTMADYRFVLCADINNDGVFCGDISEMKTISGSFDVTLGVMPLM